MLTNLYPSKDIKHLNSTAVCHYFAKEWVGMGYNVKVIYNVNKFPLFYYPILNLFNKFLAARNSQAILTIHSFCSFQIKIKSNNKCCYFSLLIFL